MRITTENVGTHFPNMHQFRKTALTRASDEIKLSEPLVVATKEGDYDLPVGWEGRIAVDSEGDPYPIAKSEFDNIYQEA